MTAGLRLMKNVLIPLAKNVLLLLGLTAAASATDEVIQKKLFGLATDEAIQKKLFGVGTTSLIISKEEMEDIVKIVKFLDHDF